MIEKYQPRYLAYCAEHGMTPEEMMAHDLIRFPGGKMAGFLIWSRKAAKSARGEG
ncbi:hypothetical protein [Paramagnetospirillum marisnigri]|uniref:hypothetical protein n=1 Tax=Paramagnetospirillum marisnigri TaxID=1285242 RepID=UPI000A4105D5|nr:hypothetical protein [Paramagnetospirillum marisnigri]